MEAERREFASERGTPWPRWPYFFWEQFFSVMAEMFVAEPRTSEHDLVWENRTSLMNQVQDKAGRVDAKNSKELQGYPRAPGTGRGRGTF